jgi:SOS-response transcriptional repressor LexA
MVSGASQRRRLLEATFALVSEDGARDLTVRTQMALTAVARLSARGVNPTNKEVGESIGVSGKDQVSHLMTRLAYQGLVEDTGGHAKAWQLTPRGKRASCEKAARKDYGPVKKAKKKGRK